MALEMKLPTLSPKLAMKKTRERALCSRCWKKKNCVEKTVSGAKRFLLKLD